MKLPDLPKLRKHKEADITPKVIEWFEKNWKNSVAVEVKIPGGRLKKHQPVALEKVKKGTFSHKLPDMGRRNPFDFFMLKNADAFIVYVYDRNCIVYNYKMEEQFTFHL